MKPQHGGLVDLHAHFLTEWYVEEASRAGHTTPDGMPRWPVWSVEAHLELMDRAGIERSILSVSSPGVQFGAPTARIRMARRLNEDAAAIRDRHPDRFGFLASLPLPDLHAASEELQRATVELGASGAVLLTNVNGVSIADPAFTPLWKDLSHNRSAVLLHPTTPPGPPITAFPAPMMEFIFDTARAVAELAFSDRLRLDAPDARVIVPHVGGAIPVLVERWEIFAATAPGVKTERIQSTLKRLWFDLAGTPTPVQAGLIAGRWGSDRIVYGSDYCFTPLQLVEAQLRALDVLGIEGVENWREATARNVAALLSN